MTENEAYTKWCPFARVMSRVGDGEHVVNRSSGAQDMSANCIASACMAWCGAETIEFKNRAEAAFRRDGQRLTPGPADIEGYCGLAGQPS